MRTIQGVQLTTVGQGVSGFYIEYIIKNEYANMREDMSNMRGDVTKFHHANVIKY